MNKKIIVALIIISIFLTLSGCVSSAQDVVYGGSTNNFTSGDVNVLNGNLNISKAGKGITLYSPDNSSFCTTVSNLGTLITTAGVCI